MTIMSDVWIREQCTQIPKTTGVPDEDPLLAPYDFKPMIDPFVDGQVKTVKTGTGEDHPDDIPKSTISLDDVRPAEKRIVSYGLSSYGYDVRLGKDFKIFTNINSAMIDPLNMDDNCYTEHHGDCCVIPPNSFILGHTVEKIRVPRDILICCLGKSTYARTGAIVNVTPLEPEWEGHVTLEISNTTPLPLKVYANMGIAQLLFFKGDRPCETSYADRGGKYQYQIASPVPAKT